MVAARRLRKSMLKDMPNINLETIDIISKSKHKQINSKSEDIYLKSGFKKIKLKYIIKILIAVIIIFLCLVLKLFFKDKILSYKCISIIVNEYKMDYSKDFCLEKTEYVLNSLYSKTKYMIPESVANNVRNNYINKVKPYLINFDLKVFFNNIFTKSQEVISTDNNDIENTGMGGGEPLGATPQTMEILSEDVIAMKDKVADVLKKNIDIKIPVQGTITSKYGNREKIFDELSTYHTGIDIANKLGTEIYSATSGIVRTTEKNNKYYGNNIEVETEGIIFKYAHLKSFNVKEGDYVSQQTVLGYMGSTGMSTGSHLHFEIKIDGQTIDPNQVLKFY